MPPTSGGATVNGFDIFQQSEQVRENLGYLPENVAALHRDAGRGVPRFPRPAAQDGPRDAPRKRIDYVVDRCWLRTCASG